MSKRYIIKIDDDDRDGAPDSPWTATVLAGPDGGILACGVGDTPKHAVRDIDWAEVAISEED